jgi:hypothetical protein
MDTVFAFETLSLGEEPGAPAGDSLLSPRFTSVGLIPTTPLLALSESMGESVVSVKLFWHKEVSPVCEGVIANSGQDGRFCIRKTCEVKHHHFSKTLLKENHLYI